MSTVRARVTARDVARAARVSQATVSYVINDNPNQKISEETRARVLAAVKELGYTPSAAARALRKGSSQVVLLVLPDVRIGPAIGELIERLEAELRLQELGLVMRRAAPTDSVSALWREIMPAAVVSLLPIGKQDQAEITAAGIFVAQSLLMPQPDETTLSVPQQLVGRLQVEHLAVHGHRRIGYARPASRRIEQFLRLRLEGTMMACVELGLELPDVQVVPADAEAAERIVRAWHAADPPVTGICAYNDEMAFVLLAGMRRAGLSAPADLAVIGMDNIPLAPFAVPPLTTIDQNLGLAARHLVALVTAGIAGAPLPRMPRSESLTLVLRESA